MRGLDHPHRPLLGLAFRADQPGDHVSVGAQGDRGAADLVQEAAHVHRVGALGQLCALLDIEIEVGRQRLDRLHAAPVGAAEDPLDAEAGQQPGQRRRLPAALGVQRPQAVVTGPGTALPGPTVPDQQDHDQAARPRLRTAFHARG